MLKTDPVPHARLQPRFWGGQVRFGRFVLTLSVDRAKERMPETERIENRVLTLRQERGLSVREMAALLDIHPDTLACIEDGSYLPSVQLALRISAFFALPVETIFFPLLSEEQIPALS